MRTTVGVMRPTSPTVLHRPSRLRKGALWVVTALAFAAPLGAYGVRLRDERDAESALSQGLSLLDRAPEGSALPTADDSLRAEALFDRARTLNVGPETTRRSRSLYHVARAYRDLLRGDEVLAANASASAVREHPDEPHAQMSYVLIALRRGEPQRAEQSLARLERSPTLTAPLRLRATVQHIDLLLDRGVSHEALSLAEGAVRANRLSPAVQLRLGLARLAVGDHEGARAAFTEARSLSPRDPVPCVHLARIARSRGQTDMARSLLEEATERDPSSAEAWLALGIVHTELGPTHDAAARAALDRATELSPRMGGPFAARGHLALRSGDPAAAAMGFRAALERDPGDAGTLTNLGVTLAQMGDRPGALRAFEEATQRAPQTGEAWNGLGAMRLALNDPASAVGALQQATVMLPDDPNPPMNLGLALERLQQWEDAERAFRECLRRAPTHEAAARHLIPLQPRDSRLRARLMAMLSGTS